MVEDVCFLYKVLPFYFLVASFYCQICMFFFICMLTPFSHFSLLLLLLLLLFFSFSLLNYNGRRRVFIYAEKVEEHIKARRWKNTLKLRFLSQKLHEYRFVRNDSAEGVEE
ncbi:hypothetical protein GmHk_12G035043 [Glycine max]|nr:hypothetical protein GmHk_12G035043 [Glycine max]